MKGKFLKKVYKNEEDKEESAILSDKYFAVSNNCKGQQSIYSTIQRKSNNQIDKSNRPLERLFKKRLMSHQQKTRVIGSASSKITKRDKS